MVAACIIRFLACFSNTLACVISGGRWLQHPLVDVQEINRRQSMIETICGEKALIDTLQKGSGMLRGMPGEVICMLAFAVM